MINVTLPDGSVVEVDDGVLSLTDGALEIAVHENEARKRTIERWKTKAVFGAIRDAVAGEMQAAENALWQVFVSRLIDDAFGESLNILGRLVGESRNGLSDPSYRVRIRARIRINQSFGTASDLLAVCRLLDSANFAFTETPPASYLISMSDPPSGFATASEIASLLGEATALGVLGLVVMPLAGGFVMGDTLGSLDTVISDMTGSIDAPLPDTRRTS